MHKPLPAEVQEMKEAALQVLLHNAHGPFHGLPRTAGWGYPEAYTRDFMISALGILVSGNAELMDALRRVFLALAETQTPLGHIVSLAHDPNDVGASDTTPLFLMALALYRMVTGEEDFLDETAQKAFQWMEYQSPGDDVIVGQLPTSDWRDEQWVLGFGLYVNMVVYCYLRLFGQDERAAKLRTLTQHFVVRDHENLEEDHFHEGIVVPHKPYYALWAYKVFSSDRFDLLGNSLAILSGAASLARAKAMIRWVEGQCEEMQANRDLAVDLPPNFFPFIRPKDPDWHPRYHEHNRPGEYHNGGIWPFICGFYIAAAIAAGYPQLAERKLLELTRVVRLSHDKDLAYGFNEWIRAQDGTPRGNDWQTWSAALYLYAVACVEQGRPIFFDTFRDRPLPNNHGHGQEHRDA